MHWQDAATGYHRPMFGSYPGLGAANSARMSWKNTYASASVTDPQAYSMAFEWGHYMETGFVPAMLVGDVELIEGCLDGIAETADRYDPAGRCQVTGRPERLWPFFNQYYIGSTMSRYDDWPHRGMLNFLYVADDDRHDKAYGWERIRQTALWAQDLFVDYLPWPLIPLAFDGNKSSTTNSWAMGIAQFSDNHPNAEAVAAGWRADLPWNTDFRMLPLWLSDARHGETYGKDVFENFYNKNAMARSIATGACPAYTAGGYAVPGVTNDPAVVQTPTVYWQRYFIEGQAVPGTRTVCPTTATPDDGSGIEHKFLSTLALFHERGWACTEGKTWAQAWHAIDNCFKGGNPNWDEAVQGRWVMERVP